MRNILRNAQVFSVQALNQAAEVAKKFRNEQKYLAQRRRGAESTKKIEHLFISNLCASASLREIVDFFLTFAGLEDDGTAGPKP